MFFVSEQPSFGSMTKTYLIALGLWLTFILGELNWSWGIYNKNDQQVMAFPN